MTNTYYVLPSCDGCLILGVKSTARGLDKLFPIMNINSTVTEEEVVTRALYLFAKESTVKDSDLEHFKQQASCFGFSGEPDFLYDPKKGFCDEGEGLFLSVSALTPEECQPLVTPLSLADSSTLYGKMTLISGYADSDAYRTILNATVSSWMDVVQSPSSPHEIVMHQEHRINGVCLQSSINISIDGDTATFSVPNMRNTYHRLPSCDGCLLYIANSTARGLDKLFHIMNIKSTVTEEELVSRALYLYAKESTVKDSDLEHFKKQASCLGFSGEPDFLYDPKKGFCDAERDFHVKLS